MGDINTSQQIYLLFSLYKINMDIEEELGLQVHHVIGKGSYGSVYYCTRPLSDEPYAVKAVYKHDFPKNKLAYFRKQAEILSSIEHANIVKFYELKETFNCIYILMEYIPGGTLKKFMADKKEHHQKFTDHQISQIVNAVLQGIRYLHKYNIIHRDLKPDNILLKNLDDLTSLKIVDFGLSAQIDSSYPKNMKTQCGTLFYMAPQIFYEPSYNKGVDIWAVGIIMYQLCTGGSHPIYREGMTPDQFKQKLNTQDFPVLADAMAENFIKKLSKRNYNQRYSVNEALQHPWITRNQYDEVPLSVNESIKSFMFTHTVADALKFCLFLGNKQGPSKRVPRHYINKLQQFQDYQQRSRSFSPSFTITKKKPKERSKKERKDQMIFLPTEKNLQEAKPEVSSPLLQRQEDSYLKLFEVKDNIDFQSCMIQTSGSRTFKQKKAAQKSKRFGNIARTMSNKAAFEEKNYLQWSPNDLSCKEKFIREKSLFNKYDTNINSNTDKYRSYTRNVIDNRNQSIASNKKTKRNIEKKQSWKQCILQPLSPTRKPESKNNKIGKYLTKNPIASRKGTNSYL